MPGPLEVVRRHHQDIMQEIDALEAAAEGLDPALPEASAAALRRVVFLRDDLRPHAVGEEHSLYPAAEPLIKKHGGAVALLEMAHLYVDDAMARFSLDVGRLLDGGLSREERETIVARVRRTVHALKAVLDVHLREEDEVVLPLLEQHLSEEEQEEIVRLMHEQRKSPDVGA
jgi:iron-sulfur cluster repair protein YtfE (RIC family)